MTVQMIANEHRQVAVDIVTPVAQASTDTETVVVGSELDMRMWRSLAYTIKNITQTIEWWVYGANVSDYSDEVIVDGPTDILANGIDSYVVAQTPYGFYRVKIKSKVGGVHGEATVRGIAKG